jgi:hypothetical protein
MSLPRQVPYSIIGLRDAMRHHGMRAPVALAFPKETYDRLLERFAACCDQPVDVAREPAREHGFSICGVRIETRED